MYQTQNTCYAEKAPVVTLRKNLVYDRNSNTSRPVNTGISELNGLSVIVIILACIDKEMFSYPLKTAT